MRLDFTKMHGAGNDFVVIDARRQPLNLDADRARRLADRRLGVGCDQILLIDTAADRSAHFAYRIINADGGQVQQCGNGARALALYAHRALGMPAELHMQSPAGLVAARVASDHVAVDMGPAHFAPARIPLNMPPEQRDRANHYTLIVNGQTITFGAVSMGNPHAVVTVNDVNDAPVAALGQALQAHPAFPESVNVGFMQPRDRRRIDLRVYERGVGETRACGTGACAAAAVGVARGELDAVVRVHLPGGELMVNCEQLDQAVWLTGPAHVAFEGHIDL